MEFDIRYIDQDASYVDVVKAFEAVLHGPDLYDPNDQKNKGRLPNFKIDWHLSETGGAGSNGTSKLTVATRRLGERLLSWYHEPDHAIRVGANSKKMRIYPSRRTVSKVLKMTLEKGLYVGPEKQVKRDEILDSLRSYLRVDKVQFGVWYKPDPASPTRSFSVEWERGYIEQSEAYLSIGYDHKVITIEVLFIVYLALFFDLLALQLGSSMMEEDAYTIIIKFSSIRKMGIGFDFGSPCELTSVATPRNY